MKYFFYLVALVTTLQGFAQPACSEFIKDTPEATLPYSPGKMRAWFNNSSKRPMLHGTDSACLVDRLKVIPPVIVNPRGGSAFGSMDRIDDQGSLLEDIGKIAVLRITKDSDTGGCLMHIELKNTDVYALWYGILASVDAKGQIVNWMYSDGNLNGGNTHGNIDRSFKVLPDHTIRIDEASWGDNTETYGFYAVYKIVNSKFVLQRRKLSR